MKYKIELHYLLIVKRQRAPTQLLLLPSFSLAGSFLSRVLYPFESILMFRLIFLVPLTIHTTVSTSEYTKKGGLLMLFSRLDKDNYVSIAPREWTRAGFYDNLKALLILIPMFYTYIHTQCNQTYIYQDQKSNIRLHVI